MRGGTVRTREAINDGRGPGILALYRRSQLEHGAIALLVVAGCDPALACRAVERAARIGNQATLRKGAVGISHASEGVENFLGPSLVAVARRRQHIDRAVAADSAAERSAGRGHAIERAVVAFHHRAGGLGAVRAVEAVDHRLMPSGFTGCGRG